MDDTFLPGEKVYRAVYPPEMVSMFWREDGTLSSAAFADPKGLSVDRGNYRSDNAVIRDMTKRFTGRSISLYVKTCQDTGAIVRYLPSAQNIYHSEIHGSAEKVLLSKSQRYQLSRKARVVYSERI